MYVQLLAGTVAMILMVWLLIGGGALALHQSNRRSGARRLTRNLAFIYLVGFTLVFSGWLVYDVFTGVRLDDYAIGTAFLYSIFFWPIALIALPVALFQFISDWISSIAVLH